MLFLTICAASSLEISRLAHYGRIQGFLTSDTRLALPEQKRFAALAIERSAQLMRLIEDDAHSEEVKRRAAELTDLIALSTPLKMSKVEKEAFTMRRNFQEKRLRSAAFPIVALNDFISLREKILFYLHLIRGNANLLEIFQPKNSEINLPKMLISLFRLPAGAEVLGRSIFFDIENTRELIALLVKLAEHVHCIVSRDNALRALVKLKNSRRLRWRVARFGVPLNLVRLLF